MFKKSFMAMMALFLVLFVAGCGGNKDNNAAPKADAEKPEYSADQAVLAYAELYTFGVTNHMKEAGFTEANTKEVGDKIVGDLVKGFSEFPLSDESILEMVGIYTDKVDKAMEIKTELVKDDPEHPVVKLSAKIIDQNALGAIMSNNEDILALGMALGELQAQGLSVDDLKANAEFQKASLEGLGKFFDAIPMKAESSVEVTCNKIKGDDGKFYWAPQDPTVVSKFVQGQ